MVEIVRVNAKRRVDVSLVDFSEDSVDIVEEMLPSGDSRGVLELEVTELSGRVILKDSYYPNDNPGQSRIKKGGTGIYYVDFGTEDRETNVLGTILFNWHARINENSEDVYRTQVLDVVSPRILSILPTFRLMIDKTVKINLPKGYCFLGYTDGMLLMYLKLGLHMINEYEPYPTFRTLNEFPLEAYSQILIKAALFQGLNSQTLFAIDTDIPSYNDQGHSFVLQHATPLASFVGRLGTELDKIIPIFKKKFVNSGTVSIEAQMNAAFYLMLSSAPYGSLFRNLYTSR